MDQGWDTEVGLPPEEQTLIYAIGDIHGCDDKLRQALRCLARKVRREDTVVFLGDSIDRGPGSRQAVEQLLEWKGRHADTVFLRGNHEQMILDARGEIGGDLLSSEALQLWWINGGRETVRSYGGTVRSWGEAVPENHWEFFESTRMEHMQGAYHFVHAGLLPEGAAWAHPDRDPRLWIREEFIRSGVDFGGRVVVFGHTPQLNGRPLVRRNKIGLDTAAVFGGVLTVAGFDPEAQEEDRLTLDTECFTWRRSLQLKTTGLSTPVCPLSNPLSITARLERGKPGLSSWPGETYKEGGIGQSLVGLKDNRDKALSGERAIHA